MFVVRKTISIHPVLDRCLKKIQATLIEKGYNVSYARSLNLALLIAMSEASKGLRKETLEKIAKFLKDPSTIEEIDLENLTEPLKRI